MREYAGGRPSQSSVARRPSPCTPTLLGTEGVLRCCMYCVVDFCLYASVLDVKRCAYCCDGTVTRFSTCGARLRGYSCFRLPYFGSVLNCQYRSIQVQVSIFQHSTIAALYKKGPGVCRGARPCAPLRFSHIPMWSTLCGLPQSMWHTAGSRNLCGYTTGVPQSMRHIRPEFRNPCGHSAGTSAAHAVIISPYKI